MSFVKHSLDEILPPMRPKGDSLQGGTFEADVLSVIYETDRAALEKILPPGLKLRGEPYVSLVMNDFITTDFCRGYKEGVLAICITDEKHGIDGVFPVALTLNASTGDTGAFSGRDFGFPKKLGDVDCKHDGDKFTAYVARHGICYANFSCDGSRAPNDPKLMEAAAQFGKVVSEENPNVATFNYIWPVAVRNFLKPKLAPAWFGSKLTTEPVVGWADVTLTFSEHDPWATLPIKKILGGVITYGQATLDVSHEKYWTDIDPDAYRPYSYSQFDVPPAPITRI